MHRFLVEPADLARLRSAGPDALLSAHVPSQIDCRYFRDGCELCQKVYRDPTPDELCIFLHAFDYTGPDWHFRAPVPEWAAEALPHGTP